LEDKIIRKGGKVVKWRQV